MNEMRGSIRQRSKGAWELRVELPRDPVTGKRRQETRTMRGTKKAAEKALVAMIHGIENGSFVAPTNAALADAIDLWLRDAKGRLTARSYENADRLTRQHVLPKLGGVPVQQLRAAHLQQLYAGLLESGRTDGKGGLSPRSVRYVHAVLHAALRHAERLQLVGRNVAELVTLPKQRRKEMLIPDERQCGALMAAARGTRLETFVILAIASGLRRAELCALKWEDLNFDHGTLTVRRAIEESKMLGAVVKEPKSERSRRTIVLLPFALEALRRYKVTQNEMRLAQGPKYKDQGFVFADEDGAFWKPNSIATLFKAIAKRAALPGLRFHALRHAHASLLIRQGASAKLVQERLGHHSAAFTLDRYGHLFGREEQEAVTRLNNLLGRAVGDSPAAAEGPLVVAPERSVSNP